MFLIDLDPPANLNACLGRQNVDALDHPFSEVIESSKRKESVKLDGIILHHDEGEDPVSETFCMLILFLALIYLM